MLKLARAPTPFSEAHIRKEKRLLNVTTQYVWDRMQMKSLTDEELTRIRLQLIVKMLEIDPELKRILKLRLNK